MGDPRGFIALRRATPRREAPADRVQHWREFYVDTPEADVRAQSGRCMDCGVPFCQSDTGCPVQNVIPEWNDLVHGGDWAGASEILHSTNNFPELTGRLCPAPCESACVLSIIDQPVTIRSIEQQIADRAFAEHWVRPRPPARESGQAVAVIGSGPAGLAAAQQLRRDGHRVVVFERADRLGGLLRYGIPDFKLEKAVLDARLEQLRAEGVEFRTNVDVGVDITAIELLTAYDAVCLTIGAGKARDLDVDGRALGGVHQAMRFLSQQNRRLAGDPIDSSATIDARGKRVIILGGGDTGSDCAGTALRQGASSVAQFELMPQPPDERASSTPWPLWPMQLRSSHAHEEGTTRRWNIATTALSGEAGVVSALHAVEIETEWSADGRATHRPVPDAESRIDADLVLLAMGFVGIEDNPEHNPLVRDLGIRIDRGTIVTDDSYQTSVSRVFAAGDAHRGASLLVWAIREGRDAAAAITRYLSSTGAATRSLERVTTQPVMDDDPIATSIATSIADASATVRFSPRPVPAMP